MLFFYLLFCSEFDKYQVSISVRRQPPVTRNRDEPTQWEFRDGLEAGKTYQVLVKTVSGKVTSWPASGNVTLKPLPVQDLHSATDDKTGVVKITWSPDNSSYQEGYKITYHEVETYNGDSNSVLVDKDQTSLSLESLLPGRNYSVTVQATSNGLDSNHTNIYVATRMFTLNFLIFFLTCTLQHIVLKYLFLIRYLSFVDKHLCP